MLESFTNVSRCFLEETKTGFQVGVCLYTVYTTEWSSLRLFPADDTPRLRPFYTFRRTHTCKRKDNFVAPPLHCVKLCFGFEWRERSLCAGAHQQLHSSKLKSEACTDRMPLCSAGQKLWKLRTRPPGLWAARPPGRTGQWAPSVPLLLPLFVCIYFFSQSESFCDCY